MAKKTSPIAKMMSKAVSPPPFVGGTTPTAMPPTMKKTSPPSKPGGGRGNMMNFRGKHAPPFGSKKT